MGRWLKKIENMPEVKLTELPKPSSVSFVGTDLVLTSENNLDKLNLIEFVSRCCQGFSVTAQQVIDHLLSIEDEQDIINGDTPVDSLRLHIKLWIENGMPHYSGKPG